MYELDVEDIINRLRDLHAYSPTLAQRRPDEEDLPEEPALWLAMKLERALVYLEHAAPAAFPDAMQQLGELLQKSYRYYLERLKEADNPWIFTFPRAMECTHAPVYTKQ